MIRRTAHSAVDFVFDVLAEVFATMADLGPHALSLLSRSRHRWVERRATRQDVPAVADVFDERVTEYTVDDLRPVPSGIDVLEAAFEAQDSRQYAPA